MAYGHQLLFRRVDALRERRRFGLGGRGRRGRFVDARARGRPQPLQLAEPGGDLADLATGREQSLAAAATFRDRAVQRLPGRRDARHVTVGLRDGECVVQPVHHQRSAIRHEGDFAPPRLVAHRLHDES